MNGLEMLWHFWVTVSITYALIEEIAECFRAVGGPLERRLLSPSQNHS